MHTRRAVKIGQYLQKLCSYEKGSSFFMTQCIYTRRLAVGLIIAGAFTCYCLLQTAVRRGSCLGHSDVHTRKERSKNLRRQFFMEDNSELNLTRVTRHTNIFSLDVHSMLQIHSTHRLLASSDDKRQESIMGLLTKAVRARKLCQGQNVVRYSNLH